MTETKLLPPPNLDDLEELMGGDKSLVLFYLTWIKKGLNATQAYLELHPNVKKGSARVLGSRTLARLTKVDLSIILSSYGLDVNVYFRQLRDGLNASRARPEMVGRDKRGRPIYTYVDEPDHQTRKAYHDKLGKLLGLEEEGGNTAVQVNIQPLLGGDSQKS